MFSACLVSIKRNGGQISDLFALYHSNADLEIVNLALLPLVVFFQFLLLFVVELISIEKGINTPGDVVFNFNLNFADLTFYIFL